MKRTWLLIPECIEALAVLNTQFSRVDTGVAYIPDTYEKLSVGGGQVTG